MMGYHQRGDPARSKPGRLGRISPRLRTPKTADQGFSGVDAAQLGFKNVKYLESDAPTSADDGPAAQAVGDVYARPPWCGYRWSTSRPGTGTTKSPEYHQAAPG